jgi:hypothetical protein
LLPTSCYKTGPCPCVSSFEQTTISCVRPEVSPIVCLLAISRVRAAFGWFLTRTMHAAITVVIENGVANNNLSSTSEPQVFQWTTFDTVRLIGARKGMAADREGANGLTSLGRPPSSIERVSSSLRRSSMACWGSTHSSLPSISSSGTHEQPRLRSRRRPIYCHTTHSPCPPHSLFSLINVFIIPRFASPLVRNSSVIA